MKTYILLIVILLSVMGCYDDQGNYDYQKINEVTKVDNVKDNYNVFLGDTLEIMPKIHFSMDSTYLDLGYEWWIDTTLFSTDLNLKYPLTRVGYNRITFCVVDHTNGMRFLQRPTVYVDSRYAKGWVVLSDRGGVSSLSYILMQLDDEGNQQYVGEDIDAYKFVNGVDLGSGPIKLVEHFISDWESKFASEITVLQHSGAVELNGSSLVKEINVAQEFVGGVLPAGVEPVDIMQIPGSGYLLNKNGTINFKLNDFKDAYHTGYYQRDPYSRGKKFKMIIPAKDIETSFLLALDETNSYCGFLEDPYDTSANGKLMPITYEGKDETLFKHIPEEVLHTSWHHSGGFLSLLWDTKANKYYFHNFTLGWNHDSENPGLDAIDVETKREVPAIMCEDFVDMAVLPYRDVAIFASGSKLYYHQYHLTDARTDLFYDFQGKKIASLGYKDFSVDDVHGAHVGVGLENGEIYIFEINDTNIKEVKILYHKEGFGKIVDLIYKHGYFLDFNFAMY